MNLSSKHQKLIDAVRDGVKLTDAYLHQLTDYHGGPLQTEYVLTTDIARALLRKGYSVATEFLINRVENQLYYREKTAPFALGSRRFDVAALDPVQAPELAVEVKIGVGSLAKVRGDLLKIIDFLECARAGFADRFLGMIVFQVHRGTKKHGQLKRVSANVKRLERNLTNQVAEFAKEWPAYELTMVPLQGPNDCIHDDEILLEENGEQSLGRTCHATRYHAIVIRKSVTREQLEDDNTTSQYLAKRFRNRASTGRNTSD